MDEFGFDIEQNLDDPDFLLDLFNISVEELNQSHDDGLDVARYMQLWAPFIQSVLTIVGNSLVLLVTSRMYSTVHPLCAYFAVQALSDISIIFFLTGLPWLQSLSGSGMFSDCQNRSEVCCVVLVYAKHVTGHLGAWMTVTLLVETLCYVIRPRRVHHRRGKHTLDVFCLLLVFAASVNIHYFWTYGLVKIDFEYGITNTLRTNFCFFYSKNMKGELHPSDGFLWIFIDHLFRDYLPLTAIILLLILIHTIRWWRGPSKESYWTLWTNQLLDPDSFYSIINIMLPVLGWVCLMTSLPLVLFNGLKERFNNLSDSNSYRMLLIGDVLFQWRLLFYSSKFFIFLATIPRFRQECRKLLFGVLKRTRISHILPCFEDKKESSFNIDDVDHKTSLIPITDV